MESYIILKFTVKHKRMKKNHGNWSTISHKATPKHLAFGRIFSAVNVLVGLVVRLFGPRQKLVPVTQILDVKHNFFLPFNVFFYIFSYQFILVPQFFGWMRPPKKQLLQKTKGKVTGFSRNSRSRSIPASVRAWALEVGSEMWWFSRSWYFRWCSQISIWVFPKMMGFPNNHGFSY